MVQPSTYDPDLDPILRIPPGKAVEAVQPFAYIEVIKCALADGPVGFGIEWNVNRAPPNLLFRRWVPNDAFVFGRTTRFLSRIGDQGASCCNGCLLVISNGVFVENTGREIATNLARS